MQEKQCWLDVQKAYRLPEVLPDRAPVLACQFGNIAGATIPALISLNTPVKGDKVRTLSSGSGMAHWSTRDDRPGKKGEYDEKGTCVTLWMLPSLMAMLAKLILFWVARSDLTSRPAFTLLLMSLFVMNGVEFSSFFRVAALEPANYHQYLWMMQLYYLAGVGVIASILDVSLSITLKEATRVRQINGVLAVTVSLLTIVPGSVIAGIEPLGELARRVPGPAITIWSAYIIGGSLISLVCLIMGVKKAPSLLQRRKSCALVLAFVPLLVSSGLIVLLMSLGYAINGVPTISVTTTLLVIVLYVSDTRYHLYNFLSSVPVTAEYKNWRKLRDLSHQLKEAAALPERQSDLRALIQDIESASIAIAIDANEGNMSKTARHIGVSRATVVRKLQPQRDK